ncbi:MAG: hypothetical protein RJB08_1904, partial [Actinomycetota bacterium]
GYAQRQALFGAVCGGLNLGRCVIGKEHGKGCRHGQCHTNERPQNGGASEVGSRDDRNDLGNQREGRHDAGGSE